MSYIVIILASSFAWRRRMDGDRRITDSIIITNELNLKEHSADKYFAYNMSVCVDIC